MTWGHTGATPDRIPADNTGKQRSGIFTGQWRHRASCPGSHNRPTLSRTEEVAWASIRAGSVPQRARAGIGGHQRSQGSNSRPPTFRLTQFGGCKQQISLRSPRSLTGKFRGSAAENRREKRTYLLLRNSAPDWTESPAPNSPTRLHITHQPDQETARSSQFARRSRSVETPAFVTGPQSHPGGKAS